MMSATSSMPIDRRTYSGVTPVSRCSCSVSCEWVVEAAAQFPELRVINVGGGLGVPEQPGQPALDLARLTLSRATGQAEADLPDLLKGNQP